MEVKDFEIENRVSVFLVKMYKMRQNLLDGILLGRKKAGGEMDRVGSRSCHIPMLCFSMAAKVS